MMERLTASLSQIVVKLGTMDLHFQLAAVATQPVGRITTVCFQCLLQEFKDGIFLIQDLIQSKSTELVGAGTRVPKHPDNHKGVGCMGCLGVGCMHPVCKFLGCILGSSRLEFIDQKIIKHRYF